VLLVIISIETVRAQYNPELRIESDTTQSTRAEIYKEILLWRTLHLRNR